VKTLADYLRVITLAALFLTAGNVHGWFETVFAALTGALVGTIASSPCTPPMRRRVVGGATLLAAWLTPLMPTGFVQLGLIAMAILYALVHWTLFKKSAHVDRIHFRIPVRPIAERATHKGGDSI